MNEDQILNRVAIEQALARLHPEDALMMRILSGLDGPPEDWEHDWPATCEAVGIYIGLKFDGDPLSEAAIRYRREAAEQFWQGKRGKLRRLGQKKQKKQKPASD